MRFTFLNCLTFDSYCNFEKDPKHCCQATGTGPGPGIGDWEWGLGMGTGNGEQGMRIGTENREYPQSQEMTI